jgi:hypothetical protein
MARKRGLQRISTTGLVLLTALVAVVGPMLGWVTGLLKPEILPPALRDFVESHTWLVFLGLLAVVGLLAAAILWLTMRQ